MRDPYYSVTDPHVLHENIFLKIMITFVRSLFSFNYLIEIHVYHLMMMSCLHLAV